MVVAQEKKNSVEVFERRNKEDEMRGNRIRLHVYTTEHLHKFTHYKAIMTPSLITYS